MSTPIYQPGIPTGTVKLNTDYENIRNNFTRADTSFGTDHVPFSSNTPQNGYHTSIHFNPISTTATNLPNNNPPQTPPVVPGIGQLFSSQITDGYGTDTALFSLTGNGLLTQLTSNFVPNLSPTNGSTFLPGGIVLKWGFGSAAPLSTNLRINFTTPFANSCFNVILTHFKNTTNSFNKTDYWVNAKDVNGFDLVNDNSHTWQYSWFAIGI